MIYAAWFIAGILLSSLCWLLILGLVVSARERDEMEAKTYPRLEVSAGEEFTVDWAEVNGAPLPPSWASGGGEK